MVNIGVFWLYPPEEWNMPVWDCFHDESKNDVVTLPRVLARKIMTSQNDITGKQISWLDTYPIFSPTKSLKSLRTARIDELADSNEPATM